MKPHFKLIAKTDQGSVLYFINSHKGSVLISVLTWFVVCPGLDLLCNSYYHIPVSSQFQILPHPSHEKLVTVGVLELRRRQKFAQNSSFIRIIKRVFFPTNTRRRREIFTRKSHLCRQLRCYLSHQDYWTHGLDLIKGSELVRLGTHQKVNWTYHFDHLIITLGFTL